MEASQHVTDAGRDTMRGRRGGRRRLCDYRLRTCHPAEGDLEE